LRHWSAPTELFPTRKPTDFGSLVDPQLIFPGVFVQGEAVKNREAGANNSNHYRLYGCLWMFMDVYGNYTCNYL
jgi:hypothetical protein